MTKIKIFFIIIILVIGLFLRLYKFNSPIADWHSFRQVDTLSVTKNFLNLGLDLFHPKYHDLSSTQSGINNPKGLRLVEFPVYNLLSFITAKLTHQNIDFASRTTSIILSLSSALIIFLWVYSITRQYSPSILSMSVFLFLPYNIFYNRTTLPENTAVFFMSLGLYLFKINPIFAGISLGISALVKPFTLILTLPIFIYFSVPLIKLIFKTQTLPSLKIKLILKIIFFTIFSLIPLYLWRQWIAQFPEGIPASAWLLNFSDKPIFPTWYRGYNINFLNQILVLRPYWWHWLILERTTLLILGGLGTIPLFLGLIYKKNNIDVINSLSLLGIFLYFIIVPGGNIQHDYYQILIIPFISITVGCGLFYIYNYTFKSKLISLVSILFIIFLSLFFSAEKIFPYYKINRPEIITAGKKVDLLTPPNSIIIAPYNGDTALLYQTNRSGFPIEVYDFKSIENQFPDKPIFFLSINYDDYTNKIISQFPAVYRDSQFIILKISK